MKDDKSYLINKLFNDETIRIVWNSEEEKYYISVVDVVGVLSGSERPKKYWSDLKKKLYEEGYIEVSDKIGRLKLKAKDGKYRLTDVTDVEGMFRIIESIPSKNAEPVKQWLARLGSERINEVFDPSIAVNRAIDTYRAKGYDEDWINKRIKGIKCRKELTNIWFNNGIKNNVEVAILTNDIYIGTFGKTAKELKEYKGLRKENLRDNMSNIEVILTDLGEESTKLLADEFRLLGLEENRAIAKQGGNIAGNARNNLERVLGKSVLSDKNNNDYLLNDK